MNLSFYRDIEARSCPHTNTVLVINATLSGDANHALTSHCVKSKNLGFLDHLSSLSVDCLSLSLNIGYHEIGSRPQ